MPTITPVHVPAGILFDPWLRDVEVRVWGAYRSQANTDLETDVTCGEIGELLGINRRAVSRALTGLEKGGYIKRLKDGARPKRRLVEP